MINVLYVHIGETIPSFIIDNIQVTLKINPQNVQVHVITDSEILKSMILNIFPKYVHVHSVISSQKLSDFKKSTLLEKGFWSHTMERFFIIENAMVHNKWQNVFHLENDVICYRNFTDMLLTIQECYSDSSIISTFDNDLRCIPGIVFFPNYKSLSMVTSFSINNPSLNDMQLFGQCRISFGSIVLDSFPLCPITDKIMCNLQGQSSNTLLPHMSLSRYFSHWNMVFDAAAIGQFIDGTDPNVDHHHKSGFVNETCYINYKKDCNLRFNNGYPEIQFDTIWYPIANLHIHSKNLKKFAEMIKI